MSDQTLVAVRLLVSQTPYQAGETCSLPRSRALLLVAKEMAVFTGEEVGEELPAGGSFVRQLNRIDRFRQRAKKAKREAREDRDQIKG